MTETSRPPDQCIEHSSDLLSRRDVLAGGLTVGVALAGYPGFAVNAFGQESPGAAVSHETLARAFQDPPFEYAPLDNWWWEAGHVERKRITWQLEDLKEKGSGGTWFYPRWVYGESLTSDPPYWSERWWDFTRFSTEEHKRLGLDSWFSNWTLTGFQQNRVRAEAKNDPSLRGRILALYQLETGGIIEVLPEDEVLEAASYRRVGNCIDYRSRTILTESVRERKITWQPDSNETILTVLVARPWDLDYLSNKVGKRFSEVILGEYGKRLPQFLGNTLKAFGDDEMILLAGNIPFARSLLDKVQAERGYDPAPLLIGLFFDIGARTDVIRCDYYDAMCSLLEENLYKASGRWLGQHGMRYATLSQLGPGDPLYQTYQVGDATRYMRTYDVPGNEDPDRTEVGERRLMASKLSSSIAHLYGRQRVAVLAYYASGWGMTQQENIAWTCENYAKGMNLYVTHSALYSLMGGWYEWVPPTNQFYSPSWRYWRGFYDYVRRLSYLLSQGKHRADVALLYPLTTIHAHWVAGRDPKQWKIDNQEFERKGTVGEGLLPFDQPAIEAATSLRDLAHAIFHDGIDFDFIDNSSLERATVTPATLSVSGVEFRVVVLPKLTTIRLRSMEKILDFYNNGGTVVAFGRVPTASSENGRDDPKLRAIVEAIFGTVSEDGLPASNKQTSQSGGKARFAIDVKDIPEVISEAVVRDVVTVEKDLFHTHQTLGALDLYFLFNTRPTQRDLAVRFRVEGEAEIWDAFTGEIHRVHRIRRNRGSTDVRLRMNPYEGVLLVFSPDSPGASVLDDDITDLVKLDIHGALSVQGFDATGGVKKVRIEYQGREYVMRSRVEPPPQNISLNEPYSFSLEPTMDNRWGDFRYPPSPNVIGAEARRFRYLEEEATHGSKLGYHTRDFDDSTWDDVIYSYGPYWLHLGPIQRGSEPRELIETAKRGIVDQERSVRSESGVVRWREYSFSQRFGYFGPGRLARGFGLNGDLLGVGENFVVLDDPPPGNDVHYLFTNIIVPDDGKYFVRVGVRPERPEASLPFPMPPPRLPATVRLWINAQEVPIELKANSYECRTVVHLRTGRNPAVLEVVRPEEGPVMFYVVLLDSEPPAEDRYVPVLKWYEKPQRVALDIKAVAARRVGWYRFLAPPGVRAIRFDTQARALQAWVDGRPVTVELDRILLSAGQPGVSQVAVRVEQEPGTYAGAAFREPVSFECEEGQIALGDWSKYGLSTYSGIGVYAKEFELETAHLRGRIILDLGEVKNVAEVFVNGSLAGTGMVRPFQFDVTRLVKTGRNRLVVKVANTLANHMSTYPTNWILEGQTVSGLLGPVKLEFRVPVSMKLDIAESRDGRGVT